MGSYTEFQSHKCSEYNNLKDLLINLEWCSTQQTHNASFFLTYFNLKVKKNSQRENTAVTSDHWRELVLWTPPESQPLWSSVIGPYSLYSARCSVVQRKDWRRRARTFSQPAGWACRSAQVELLVTSQKVHVPSPTLLDLVPLSHVHKLSKTRVLGICHYRRLSYDLVDVSDTRGRQNAYRVQLCLTDVSIVVLAPKPWSSKLCI